MAETRLEERETERLRWDEATLIAEHDYPKPHVEAALRLHGGIAEDGHYISPRTLNRWPAVRAWQRALAERRWPLLEADTALLSVPPFPNEAQQRLLVREGLGQAFWNSLSITGIIEARGIALVDFKAPDFQAVAVDDISEMCIGHLNAGLLKSHGWDEGGRKDLGVGGHDDMWFAVRDLLFGKDRWPVPEPPASIARPVEGRELPQLPEAHEGTLKLLMNVLMIEVRAERTFRFYEDVISTPGLFECPDADRDLALELVDRIRTDEAIHVAYLQTVISEFRSLRIRTVDGEVIPGEELVDPLWAKMVHWHAVEVHEANRPTQEANMRALIATHADAERVQREFDALATS
ncbi:MAG: hypothetical protein V2J24_07800 [Pseudomonadales bacterium]|jgi:hypothetical protein|nr:hypothetical protein [Pseudomonadales bacterium]